MFSARSGGFFATTPTVTKNLVIINLLVWFASLIFPSMTQYLGLHFFPAGDFRPHQLITYMFMHSSDFGHVFFNMFAVLMFGRILEQFWGSKRFLIYYMVTGIGAALIQELTWYIDLKPYLDTLGTYADVDRMLNRMITVGASGAVFGILLGFGMLFPNAPIYLMFIPIPIKAKWMVIGYGVIELFEGVANFSGDNVAHFAHLGGMLFGFVLIMYWKRKGVGNGIFFG